MQRSTIARQHCALLSGFGNRLCVRLALHPFHSSASGFAARAAVIHRCFRGFG